MDRDHWDRAYARSVSEELGWYEAVPSTLQFVTAHSTPADSVIDVGGGDSRLVDALLERGHTDLTVVDLSAVALERSRARLGDEARAVTWIDADVKNFEPGRRWDLWHDRAVFHFLVEVTDRAAYADVARRCVEPGGHAVIAAFAPEGPDRCAGLPVVRYDAETLAAELGTGFALVERGRIEPLDDVGDQRPYVVAVLERV